MTDRLRYLLALLCCLAAFAIWTGTPLIAQDGGDDPDRPVPTLPRGNRDAVDLDSPRGTLDSFFRAYNDAAEGAPSRMADALLCLQMSSSERAERGRLQADKLKDVLDRHGKVDINALPGRNRAAELAGVWSLETRAGPVSIVLVGDDWLVSRITLSRLDTLLAEFERLGIGEEQRYEAFRMRQVMPEVLRRRALFLEHWQWLGLVVLILLSWIADRIVVFVTRRVIGRILRSRSWLERAAQAAEAAGRPVGLIAVGATLWLAAPFLELPARPISLVFLAEHLAPMLFASLGLVMIAYRLVDVITARMLDAAHETETKLDDQLVPLLGKSMKVLVTVAGVLFILDNLEADIWSLLTGLGVGALAVALAARDTLANLFGSVTVFLDKPFQVGDWVIVGGVEGTVEEVGFRSTRVRTFYNSLISVPNAKLVDTAIDNMGRREFRRFKTRLGVKYDTPPEKLEAFCAGLREIVLANPHMRHDYFEIYLNGFGPAALEILVYVFFKVPGWDDELRERQNFIVETLRLAQTLGVEFAFPTQTLHIESTPERPPQPPENPPVDELDTMMRRFGRGGDMARPGGTPQWSTASPD